MHKILDHLLSNVIFRPCDSHKAFESYKYFPAVLKCSVTPGCNWEGRDLFFAGLVAANQRTWYYLQPAAMAEVFCGQVPYSMCTFCEARVTEMLNAYYITTNQCLEPVFAEIRLPPLRGIIHDYLFAAIVRCPFCV